MDLDKRNQICRGSQNYTIHESTDTSWVQEKELMFRQAMENEDPPEPPSTTTDSRRENRRQVS